MIKRHSGIWFYIFTLIFTIVLGGISQALFAKLISGQYQTILSLVLIQTAPTLGMGFIVFFTKDKGYFKNMNWLPIKNTIGISWLLLSFIIPVTIVGVASVIMSVYDKVYIPNNYPIKLLIVTILGTFIGCIGEEIGWRGFMQQHFNRRYSLISSAIFTGILWGVWHFGKLASFGILGYSLFILLITEFSIIMAWIYSKTNKNMICMVLFHSGVNISSILLLQEREGIMFYTVACIISTLVCLALVLTNWENFSSKLSTCES